MSTRLQFGESMRPQHIMNGHADLADLSYVRHRIRAVADTLEYLPRDVLPLSRRRNRLQEGEELFAPVQCGEVQALAIRATHPGELRCRGEAHRRKNQGRRQQ